MMFNPENQYRCTIIRGKAQKELDNLLPSYANFINETCPTSEENFTNEFNDYLSLNFYDIDFESLSHSNKKTIRNHITEIAGKLFGLYYYQNSLIHESEACAKLMADNDQPAFFKNLCLNFQFPNGTQKIRTIQERIDNRIKFKPFHFILAVLKLAKIENSIITKNDIGYYILNAKEVLQGNVSPKEVLKVINERKNRGVFRQVESGSYNTQHIREQLNILLLSNMIRISGNDVYLNSHEYISIELFIESLNHPLSFDIYSYDFTSIEEMNKMYVDWGEYFGTVNVSNYNLLSTSIDALQKEGESLLDKVKAKGVDHTILGDEGEEFVFNFEKDRVGVFSTRLINKVILFGKQRGLGYDVLSVEADENLANPEFARFIEVKSTKRTTTPDLNDKEWVDTINLTRKEWIAAKQYKSEYNIYRVYFTPNETIIRKINNPFEKNKANIISVLPTMYRMDFNSFSIDKEY